MKITGQIRRCFKFKPVQYYKVFVYGTLKRGERNHHWLTKPENGKGTYVADGITKNKYPLIIASSSNIPYLLYIPGEGHNVKGEVYEVDDLMLEKLDVLEGHPDYYTREVDDIEVTKGFKNSIESCWVYFLKKFNPEMVSKPRVNNYSSSGNHSMF